MIFVQSICHDRRNTLLNAITCELVGTDSYCNIRYISCDHSETLYEKPVTVAVSLDRQNINTALKTVKEFFGGIALVLNEKEQPILKQSSFAAVIRIVLIFIYMLCTIWEVN